VATPWRPARSLDTLLAQINAAAPGRERSGDGAIGDQAHEARASDHNPDAAGVVRARDFTHDPAGGFDAHAYAEVLRRAADPRVAYIISRRRISVRGGAWQTYSGASPHTHHVHVSVVHTAAADATTPWPAVPKKGPTTMPHAVSPFEGRLTSAYGRRSVGFHAGLDIAPPKAGEDGGQVVAMFAGTVKKVHRTAMPGGKSSTWAPGRTGNGVLIANADGEGNGYNHMRPVAGLKVGDKVEPGEVIGHLDRSGTQSGPHLHFEMWKSWRDPSSHYDPQLAFKAQRVRAGSEPSQVSGAIEQPEGSAPGKPKYVSVERGDFGPTVGRLQRALKAKGYTKQIVDNDFGAQTEANVRDWQHRKRLVEDGVAGPITQKSLGL
jgi:murein DD-endopeptidase MepM/ murein hydrolase activator NlpD